MIERPDWSDIDWPSIPVADRDRVRWGRYFPGCVRRTVDGDLLIGEAAAYVARYAEASYVAAGDYWPEFDGPEWAPSVQDRAVKLRPLMTGAEAIAEAARLGWTRWRSADDARREAHKALRSDPDDEQWIMAYSVAWHVDAAWPTATRPAPFGWPMRKHARTEREAEVTGRVLLCGFAHNVNCTLPVHHDGPHKAA
jgi:hypothetical protein